MANTLVKPDVVFQQMADDINKKAKEYGVSPMLLAAMIGASISAPINPNDYINKESK